LSEIGKNIGLLPDHNYQQFCAKKNLIENELSRLNKVFYELNSLAKILSRPETSYKDLPSRSASLSPEIIEQVEISIKYAGYIDRQELEVQKFRNLEDKQIPITFDFETVPSLRTEARQKLSKIRPATVGQAARISGVSPADISILLVWLKRSAQKISEAEMNCEAGANDLEE
jgi:tRNA uridine 5-carboxymethylaminomethyl modification enzyme